MLFVWCNFKSTIIVVFNVYSSFEIKFFFFFLLLPLTFCFDWKCTFGKPKLDFAVKSNEKFVFCFYLNLNFYIFVILNSLLLLFCYIEICTFNFLSVFIYFFMFMLILWNAFEFGEFCMKFVAKNCLDFVRNYILNLLFYCWVDVTLLMKLNWSWY